MKYVIINLIEQVQEIYAKKLQNPSERNQDDLNKWGDTEWL